MTYSKAKLKSRGDKASPCFRPFWIGKLLISFISLYLAFSKRISYVEWKKQTKLYTFSPIALPGHRNLHRRSLLTLVSATSAPPFHHLRLSKVYDRISRLSCDQLYAVNRSQRKQQTFFMNIFALREIRIRERFSPVARSSNTVAILTTETMLRKWKCESAT
jgi:hypothetical protein